MPLPTDDTLAALDLWLDGALSASDAAVLLERVDHDPELQDEKRRLKSLRALLSQETVEVSPDFADAIMSRLPPRRRRSAWPWAAAAAFLVATGVIATALLRSATESVAGEGMLAPLAAVGDFFATVLLAGVGLLAASWRAVGQLVSGWLGASAANLILGALVLVGVNLLLVSLLRRRGLAAERVKGDRDDE